MLKRIVLMFLIPFFLLSMGSLVMGIPTVQMAPGESKDINEEFDVWKGYHVTSFTLVRVEGDDASLVSATLISWHQDIFDPNKLEAKVNLTLDDSAPAGAELSIILWYHYTFSSGHIDEGHRWIIKVTGDGVTLIANFTGSPTEGNAPLTVQFTDQSTGNITSWDWDFGDGQTSSEQNPPHTYQNPGTYTVSLTVEGTEGSDIETKENYILVEVQTDTIEVTFDVKVPTFTSTDDVIYLAGSFNFWDPGPGQAGTDGKEHDLPMNDVGNNNHQITLNFDIGESVEYKYTRGSWGTVETGSQGEEISNRKLTIPEDNYTQHDTVVNWSDLTFPNIIVTPDTLFFAVGTSNSKSRSILNAQENLRSTQKIPDEFFRVVPYAETIQLSSTTPLQISLSELDTLSNSFESYFYMLEPWQTRYEATKLIPDRSCKLEALRFSFYNYQNSEKSKRCKLFVWEDNGGKPGTLLWSANEIITIPSNKSDWVEFDIADQDINVNDFWLGHQENSEGAPTSLHDTLGTPGMNCYSLDGINWSQIDDDYLQQAIVSYHSSDDRSVAYLSVQNAGNADLHVSDIYCSKDWVESISSNSFTLEPGGQKNVEICCMAGNLNNGQYIDNLKITSDDPDTPVYEVVLLFDVVTSVQDISSEVPGRFALKQNYPNPFNATTAIRIAIPHEEFVSMEIYNSAGQRVASLLNRKLNVGLHEVRWNACDMASGVYFCRLRAGRFQELKKMILLK